MAERKLFHEVTGLTWDINKLIENVKTEDDKKELLRKLDWYIPEGAYLANAEKRDKAIELINTVTTELGIKLSEVFVDVDGDGDVDAYDVIDTKEPAKEPTDDPDKPVEEPTEGSVEFSGVDFSIVANRESVTKSEITLSSPDMTYKDSTLYASGSGKTFKIKTNGVLVTEIDILTTSTSVRFKDTGFTNETGTVVATSCVRDEKSYTVLIDNATTINCKNKGGGVSISSITVKYKQAS